MNDNKRLLYALGNVDDKYIDEAAEPGKLYQETFKEKKAFVFKAFSGRRLGAWVAGVAAIAAVAIGVSMYGGGAKQAAPQSMMAPEVETAPRSMFYAMDSEQDEAACDIPEKYACDMATEDLAAPECAVGAPCGATNESKAALSTPMKSKLLWAAKFDPDKTEAGVFYAASGGEEALMMKDSSEGLLYSGDAFTAVRRAFGSLAYAWFILPNEGGDTDEVLDSAQMWDMLSFPSDYENAEAALLNVSIPVFEASDQVNRIRVDEEGVEAPYYFAAQGNVVPEVFEAAQELDFICNRPFIFAICDTSGAVLFIAAVDHVK